MKKAYETPELEVLLFDRHEVAMSTRIYRSGTAGNTDFDINDDVFTVPDHFTISNS